MSQIRLPSLRSLDIARFLPTRTSPDSPPSITTDISASAQHRVLTVVEEELEEEEEEEGEEVIVLKPKISSRLGMKLTTQVCVPW
ncbi:uncharacterized protein JCM6883_001278 [Sporobolomyces salmoneus]|uniref:uncharacterized protein n=1 Tax=Sporobolomyces salmoneus TaxID=183962 RepID=UPI00316BD658